jgi:hypothetical protein
LGARLKNCALVSLRSWMPQHTPHMRGLAIVLRLLAAHSLNPVKALVRILSCQWDGEAIPSREPHRNRSGRDDPSSQLPHYCVIGIVRSIFSMTVKPRAAASAFSFALTRPVVHTSNLVLIPRLANSEAA